MLTLLVLTAEHRAYAQDQCVDEELAEKLSHKRRRRGQDPRDFVKAQRHEITARGGYYVSDLLSSTWTAGGSYAYHPSENFAVEGAVLFTHANGDVVRAVEGGQVVLVGDSFSPVTFGSAALLWYPLHGKLRVGGSIVHFDVHLDLGVGVVDASTSRGAMGLVGGGLEFYAGSASAIRIDIRDHLYRQELLDTSFLVSDMTFTVGYSIFLPLEL